MAEIKKFIMRRWNGTGWDYLYPKTSADLVIFDDASTVITAEDVQGALEALDSNIGDLSTLTTTEKGSLVGAINELESTVSSQVLSWTVSGDTGSVTVNTDEIVDYEGDSIISTAVSKTGTTTTVSLTHATTTETTVSGLLDGEVFDGITIDGYGHITGLSTRTLDASDIMSTYVDSEEEALDIDAALADIDTRLDAVTAGLLVDGILDADGNTYNPYSTKTGATDFVHFYYGTTDPDDTATRLNVNANLYAAKFNNVDLSADGATARSLIVGASTADEVAIFGASGELTSEAQLDISRGGTGIGTYTKGDFLYADANDSLAKRAIGTQNQVLVVASDGTPVWSTNLNVGTINASDITMTGTLRGPSEFIIDASPDGKSGAVIIEGDLIVKGDTTTVNSQNVTIKDAFIMLNSDMDSEEPGFTIPVVDAGIEIERYDQDNVKLFWDESENEWAVTDGVTLTSQDTNTDYSQFTLMHTGNFTVPMVNTPITDYAGPVYVGAMVYEVIETVAV